MQQYKDVDNYHCGNCKYFKVNADKDESTCKRIDHKTVKFAVPFFKSYDCNQHAGVICSDFQPAEWCVHACKVWTGFEDYWKAYVEQGQLFIENPFIQFSILKIPKNGFKEQFKSKMINGKWGKSDELEKVLVDWDVVK